MSATSIPVPLDDRHRDAITSEINCWLGSVPEEFDDVQTVEQFDQALDSLQAMRRAWHAVQDGELTVDEPVRQLLEQWRSDCVEDIAAWEKLIATEPQHERSYRECIARGCRRLAALDELLDG